MTSPSDAHVVEKNVLEEACERVGLAHDNAVRIHRHATAIYLLPRHELVARVRHGCKHEQAQRAVNMTRWLMKHGFPVIEPLDVPQPVQLADYTVTFWVYYPQTRSDPPPSAGDLGRLLRELHGLPPAPIDLPQYEPLVSFIQTVRTSLSLPRTESRWLLERGAGLLDDYADLDFVLSPGHLHGDAYPGNLLWDRERVILGDWDEASVGPREIDLVNTFQGVRYGRSAEQLRRFTDGYGYDLATWSGFSTLRSIRDLHTLGAFIRRADQADAAAARELNHRVATLRRGSDERWTAVR